MTQKDYDHLFKLLIIGESGVGKSSLLLRFADNTFTGTYITTIGVDFKLKTVNIDGARCKLQIWDTAGQERFRTITTTYYRGTHGVIVVYDVQDAGSFRRLGRWLDEINSNCSEAPSLLIGNKDDDEDGRPKAVLSSDASDFAQSQAMPFFETSAKTGKNVQEMFHAMTKMCLEKKRSDVESGAESTSNRQNIVLKAGEHKSSGKSKSRRCCAS